MTTVLDPAITVVEQPIELKASPVANLLFERLKKGAAVSSNVIEIQIRLVIRESCGCTTGN
jgi:DNA-binding LacI/PurR family transcriptional regulator